MVMKLRDLRQNVRRQVRDSQRSCSGGLNLAANPEQLRPNELRWAENVHLDEFGGVVKRGGLQRIFSNPEIAGYAPIQGGTQPRHGHVNLFVADGNLYQFSWTEVSSNNPVVGLVNTGLSAIARPVFAVFRDSSGETVYIADGGLLNKTDSSSTVTANIASTPAVTFIWTYNNRLYGVNGTSNTLYGSKLDDGDTLGISGSDGFVARVGGVSMSPLVAGAALGGSNILFHQDAVSRFTGWTQDDINIEAGTQGISPNIGTIAPHSVIVVGGWVYFLSATGFYRAAETGNVQLISTRLGNTIAGIDPAGITTIFQRVSVIHNEKRREIMWHLPFNLGCYCYNYQLEQWTGPFTGSFTSVAHTLTSMWNTTDSYARPCMMTGWSDGRVRVFERSAFGSHCTDDAIFGGTLGNDYDARARVRRFFFNSPTRQKSLRRAFVHHRPNGSIASRLEWRTRHGAGSAVLNHAGVPLFHWATVGDSDWSNSLTPTRVAAASIVNGFPLDRIGDDNAAGFEFTAREVAFTSNGSKVFTFLAKQSSAYAFHRIHVEDLTAAAVRLALEINFTSSTPVATIAGGFGTLISVVAEDTGWRFTVTAVGVIAANVNQFRVMPTQGGVATDTASIDIGDIESWDAEVFGLSWDSAGPWDGAGPYDGGPGMQEEINRVQIHGKGEYADFEWVCPDNAPARFAMLEAQAFDLGERAT